MATGAVVVVGASAVIEVSDPPEGLFLRAANQEPFPDDEDYDRRPQRRRYEEPLFVQVRRQLLTIAESVGSPSFKSSRRVVVLHCFGTGH